MNKGNTQKSFCENSMKMAANIVKLSSFSIARLTIGASGPPDVAKKPASSSGPHNEAVPQSPRTDEEDGSLTLTEGKFWDYIRKVHEKNRNVSSTESSAHSPFIIPPPPCVPMQLHR
ncbi:hypothetical protein NMG60_11009557 [Bertholletia excelsa]